MDERTAGLDASRDVFVTLNPPREPDPALTFARCEVWHPQYDASACAAQRRLAEIQGRNRTWFCGAWTGHGFHEDGLVSGMAVADALGARIPWRDGDMPLAWRRRNDPAPLFPPPSGSRISIAAR